MMLLKHCNNLIHHTVGESRWSLNYNFVFTLLFFVAKKRETVEPTRPLTFCNNFFLYIFYRCRLSDVFMIESVSYLPGTINNSLSSCTKQDSLKLENFTFHYYKIMRTRLFPFPFTGSALATSLKTLTMERVILAHRLFGLSRRHFSSNLYQADRRTFRRPICQVWT